MTESKFTPGKSGNPNGRPKNKTAPLILKKAISDAMPEIIQSLIDAALSGDTQAATTLLNRCVPALKAEAQTINLPTKSSLVEQGAAIVKATMSGNIAPDVGAALISALSNQSRIVEIDELTKRLEILEASR
jgi:dihydrodipicolinate synthase/N-acetylneuraminate lyase